MLEVCGLNKSYLRAAPGAVQGESSELQILRDVNLEVSDGEFVSLIGPSGCGKTTLIRTIAKLVPPDAGEVLIAGRRDYDPGRDVCLVFQDSGLLPWYTTHENIEYGLKLQGVSRDIRTDRVRYYLGLMGLEGFAKSYPHELSGGMRQRVGLARALACEPRILLLDEPFASVDAQTRERLQEELLRLWELNRTTVLFVTHSIDEAAFLSDRVIVLRTLANATGGPQPSVSAERLIELARPRDRYGEEYRGTAAALRKCLSEADPSKPTSSSSLEAGPAKPDVSSSEVDING